MRGIVSGESNCQLHKTGSRLSWCDSCNHRNIVGPIFSDDVGGMEFRNSNIRMWKEVTYVVNEIERDEFDVMALSISEHCAMQ